MIVPPGSEVVLNLTLSDNPGNVQGVDLTLSYLPTVVELLSVSKGPLAVDWLLVNNVHPNGLVDIALAGVTPPTGNVVLVRLTFRGVSQKGQVSAVAFQRAQINEVDVSASTQAGQITIDMPPVACFSRTLGHTGDGTDPVALPINSTGCASGQYVTGETIALSGATADTGRGIASWTGTGDDGSITNTNSLTMPASAHSVAVNYLRLLGDVNIDGLANSTDALIVLSADADLNTSQFCPLNCGDVNADGLVNSTDALIILSYDARLTVPFPLGQAGCPSSVTPPPGCTP